MALLKRNIWTLFWLILLGGTLLLSVILNARWNSLYALQKTHHTNRVQLVAQAMDNVLRTQELVLDVIGRELLNTGDALDSSRQLPLLDRLLSLDHALVGFGLARADGTLVRVSSNLDLSKLPNLRTHPSTAESFAQSLNSTAMVMGRTYFVDALNSWVIPIRKALRDENGGVIAVMTAGLRMDADNSLFNQVLHDGPHDSVMLLRDSDGYLQFISRQGVDTEIYAAPWMNAEERAANHRHYQSLGVTPETLRMKKEAFVLETEHDGQEYLTAVLFNERYRVWVLSETSREPIRLAFSELLLHYLLIFMIVVAVLYGLFRLIDRAEKQRRQDLLYHSTHDDLTDLLNRAGLLQRLNTLLPRQQPFSLVLINIDNFKGINDRFGQNSGDATLVAFSRELTAALDDNDDLARLGGDEFVILTPTTEHNSLQLACHNLAERLSRTFEVGQIRLQLTASLGVASYPEHGKSASSLLRSAHLALYKAKESRNAVSIYRSEMEMAYLRRLSVEQRLRNALSRQALHMVYQPQVDECGQIVGLEALVRWQDEELGFVSPAEFVEVAEQCGLMLPLGHFVLDTSLKEYSELRSQTGKGLDLAINISVIQFEQPDFVENVLCRLKDCQVPPGELVLEITESLVMTNVDQVLLTIKHLQRQGIRISMDDFGTGYSSLSLLRDLPINELKIDKSFVDNILHDPRAANMIQSILYIARGHEMDVVVEGVELEAQASELVLMGCRRFQGYYFSRPEKLEHILAMCRTQLSSPDASLPLRAS